MMLLRYSWRKHGKKKPEVWREKGGWSGSPVWGVPNYKGLAGGALGEKIPPNYLLLFTSKRFNLRDGVFGVSSVFVAPLSLKAKISLSAPTEYFFIWTHFKKYLAPVGRGLAT